MRLKKKAKWVGLLATSLFVLTACGTGPVTSQSSGAWDQLIYWFASVIQFLSINGQIGIGIILFTILIRTLLLPLFQIQINSSRKMQELQPKLKALQAEYPGTDMESRQQLYEATQALYKENGVSMRSSMIPLLIQMPILLALFQALTRVEVLKVGHFLWLNLGEPDPIFVLPVLAAGFTFLSTWLTNKSAIEKNMAMTVMTFAMPVMIFLFALPAASGVALYWTVSNAYQVVQTLVFNNPFKIIAERQAKIDLEKELQSKKRKAQKKAKKKKYDSRREKMKFTGSSVEEAIQNGLVELNIPRKRAHITVVAREKKGFFGFGKKPAIVDIYVINETTVVKANQKAVRGVPTEINELNEPVKSISEATIDLGKVVAAVKDFEKSGQTLEDDIKAQILKNEKEATTILEETGRIEILPEELLHPSSADQLVDETIQDQPATTNQSESTSEFADIDIKVESQYDIEQVVAEVSEYVQEILDDMDVEARIETSHNRRTINIQVDTNEPGRVIGYHGKVLKALQLLAQNFLYNRYERNFYITINVNDYVEHRAEVLQGYAQKLAERVITEQEAYHTDPMSSNERKIIHRIISKMDGVTSYSEGSEPNRYVVVDIEGNRD